MGGGYKMTRQEKIKRYIEFIEFDKKELRAFLPLSYHLNLNLQVKYLELFGCYVVSSRVNKNLRLFRTLEYEKEADISFMENTEVEKEMLKSIQTKNNTLKEIALTKKWQPVPKTLDMKVNLKKDVIFRLVKLERYKTLIRAYLKMNDEEFEEV